ncbi:hypothetical protein M758_8G154000 [Ceratodon purpureus]|nr:hypothetical protein M758_8G154000 [Ceratodon purpureus]
MSHSRCSWLMCRRFLLPKNTKTFSDAESGHDSSASTTWKISLGLIQKIRGSREHILKPYVHNICVLFFTTNMTSEILCVSYSLQVPYCRNSNMSCLTGLPLEDSVKHFTAGNYCIR